MLYDALTACCILMEPAGKNLGATDFEKVAAVLLL